MPKTKEKFMIIDGNAIIHRSFHALPPTMATKTGEMVNAVYGFATVLIKAIREIRPDYIALTLDKKGPTFRHEKYKEYKAGRVKAPDELYMQIPRVKELAKAFNIPIFEQTGFEADDLIGTLAAKTDKSIENIIVTGDMDELQLINDRTKVYKLGRGLQDASLFDAAMTKSRYGFSPEQVVDYKSLAGDASDNIPGVKGIGDKTALGLLDNFGSLDNVYKNINSDKIKDRIRGLLLEHKTEAYLSYELATIKRDVKIDFSPEKLRFGGYDKNDIIKLLSELEFKSLLPRIHDLFSKEEEKTPEQKQESAADKFERNTRLFKYTLVDDDKKFNVFLAKLKKQAGFAFDTETSGLDPISADLLGVSFSWKEGEAYYINVKRQTSNVKGGSEVNLFTYQNKESSSEVRGEKFIHPWLSKLKPILENPQIKKFAHNGKFDIRVMRANGVEAAGFQFDTMIASYLLNPGSRQHNLDTVTFTELKYEKISKDDLLGSGRDRIGFSEVEMEKLSLYSCEDADFTNRLVRKLKNQLKEQKLEKLFNEIEMPLVPVLATMEDNGCLLDKKFLADMSRAIAKKILALENMIHKVAGTKFNIKSTQQLKEVLFEKLEIPALGLKRNKTGLSTAADELDKLKDQHPIVPLIQEYRELTKLASTYIDALPELINKKTGLLHTSYNQTITATGRLSSSDPNLQNIPVRTDLGREIRKAFIASPGYLLLGLDYSQIELRLAASMSGDKKMIAAFKNGADIHTATAAEINQINPEAVDLALRREAKAINFGILYGQGPHGLSRAADIPYARAREFIEQYFAVYTGVKEFIDRSVAEARERGYAETIFGRRRLLPEINSTVAMVRAGAERMAINTPLQGTAADMIKVAMIKAQDLIEKEYAEKDEARMIMTVHDELVFEVKKDRVAEFAQAIKTIMENVIKLKVPVVADAKIGENWGEMTDL
ncbi:MAG: DNA polymerase I [Candidatus Falkowbacteria bacterium]